VQHPRFYFFDPGVLNGLLGNFHLSADRSGNLFEHLICSQILSSAAALDRTIKLYAYRTEHGVEVDFILNMNQETITIETKASRNIGPADLRGFASFADYYGKPHRPIVLYLGTERRKIDAVDIFPWQEGLRAIGL
jgi:predicted AAA+ superfamily ATPase